MEATETAYLCADYQKMGQFSHTAIEKSRTILDRVRILEVLINAAKARYQLQEAFSQALTVLDMLGVKLPAKPSKLRVAMSYMGTKAVLYGKPVESLGSQKAMTSPHNLAVLIHDASPGDGRHWPAGDVEPFPRRVVRPVVQVGLSDRFLQLSVP